MKLRKALDKARKERETNLTNPLEGIYEHEKEHAPPESMETKNSIPDISEKKNPVVQSWESPVYTKSKEVPLDLKSAEQNRCISLFPDSKELEVYKVLRAQIMNQTKQNRQNTIMITSAVPNEGKSVTAINLAVTFAKEFNQTVLLVDCDLRRQMIHKYLGLNSDKGIVDCLLNKTPLEDVILWPGLEKLTLISGGRTIVDSAEILGSEHMKSMVADFKSRYSDRYIIFDVPPVLAGADAMVFAQLVDRIIMVVESGGTSMHDVNRALELIPKEKFLGFVLNKHDAPLDSYAYYYKNIK